MATQEETQTGAAEVARAYFDALARRDPAAMASFWAPGGREHIRGQIDTTAPDGVRDFFAELFAAVPDWSLEVVSQMTEGDRSAVQWRATGTFAGEPFQGIAATGSAIELEGCDVLTIRDGRIVNNDAFSDGATFARQIGMLPPQDSAAQERLTRAFNVKTRMTGRLAGEVEEVAAGVWRIQGEPARCNVYFLRDGDGVTMFDAGGRMMLKGVRMAAAQLGGLQRVVLGHGHTDHRGVAPFMGVPVFCHSDEVLDAEGSGGWRYWDAKLSFLPQGQRQMHRLFHRFFWDGGPVKIAGTVQEGDDVAGFRVVHVPGHAPGLIALHRESDGVTLCSDVVYTLDNFGRDTPPHIPIPGYNLDTEQARGSIRKLAALDSTIVFPGHAEPVREDVRAQLERAAG
jgi:steroid delta-isomerase-like uncharacterized protein